MTHFKSITLMLFVSMLFLSNVSLAKETLKCGDEIKSEVAKQLSAILEAPLNKQQKLKQQAQLYEEYQFCLDESKDIQKLDTFKVAAKQCGANTSQIGSLRYEEMSCCGYDPQRRQFACPVKIKQPFGFGSAPLPGSREYVLHCVADAGGTLLPVGHDSVHLANELHDTRPNWQFAVIANAHENLHTVYPMDGTIKRARSILSWGFQPTSCDYRPIWGNALNYRIRLDQ